MFTEDQLLPISALQHLLYCERQAALIHVERLWAENRLTVEGRHLHDKAHDGPDETRAGVRIARGVSLRSFRLGLYGVSDVIEFHAIKPGEDPSEREGNAQREGEAPAEPPMWQRFQPNSPKPSQALTPYPVEYKRGQPKKNAADRVQLCAQALCIEEMLDVSVPAGALFYGRTRRRREIEFTADLRQLTTDTAAKLHALLAAGRTPTARYERAKCDRCSLLNLCLPAATGSRKSVARYIDRALATAGEATQGNAE